MNLEDMKPALAEFTKAANGKIDATAEAVKEVREKQGELQARLQNVEQKADRRSGGYGAPVDDVATMVAADEGFAMLKAGRTKSASIILRNGVLHQKAGMTSASGASLLTPDHQPSIVYPNLRRLTIRDLLPVIRTESGSIDYVREVTNVNGATTVAEGQLKPESSVTFERINAAIVTIATWVQASKQILDDAKQLQLYLENRLIFNIRFAEELQLLKGSGVGNNLTGLFTGATPFAAPVTVPTPTRIDVLRLAIGQLEDANYNSTGIVLHPDDWTIIDLMKIADGRYLKSDPAIANVRTLWGRPVVTTTAMTVGTFLTGDFAAAATLYDRQDPTLDIATQDQDDFVRNLIKLRVEERVSMALQLPGALVKGSFAP